MAAGVAGRYRPSAGSSKKLRSRSRRWIAVIWSAVDVGHASGSARAISDEVGGAGGGSGWPRSMAVAEAASGGTGLGSSGVATIGGGAAVAASILGIGGLAGSIGVGTAVAGSTLAASIFSAGCD